MIEFLKPFVTSNYFVGWSTGFGLICIAFLANKISKQQLKMSRREYDLSIFDNLNKVRDYYIDKQDYDSASKVMHQTYSHAQIFMMPKFILNHIRDLRECAWKMRISNMIIKDLSLIHI